MYKVNEQKFKCEERVCDSLRVQRNLAETELSRLPWKKQKILAFFLSSSPPFLHSIIYSGALRSYTEACACITVISQAHILKYEDFISSKKVETQYFRFFLSSFNASYSHHTSSLTVSSFLFIMHLLIADYADYTNRKRLVYGIVCNDWSLNSTSKPFFSLSLLRSWPTASNLTDFTRHCWGSSSINPTLKGVAL